MTPAVDQLTAAGIAFELLRYKTKVGPDLALTVANELGIDHASVFKTLITEAETGALFVALVPAASELDLKKLAQAAGVKKVHMADQKVAERSSGYLKGAISPVGQKQVLPTFMDASAEAFDAVFVSAGRRGLELKVGTEDLVRHCDITLVPLVTG